VAKPEEIKTCSIYRRRMCSCKEHCVVRQKGKKQEPKIQVKENEDNIQKGRSPEM
jgi:hypothetical protein